MTVIEDWAIEAAEDQDPYSATELRGSRLTGYVYGHERLDTSRRVRTSRITHLDIDARVAVTRNTTYALGSPSPKYMDWLSQFKPEWFEKLNRRTDGSV